MTALDRLQADIVAGRSLDVAPFNTIASLQTLHTAAAAELGLDVGATTAQIAQALNESASREAARASLARARRLEGPAAAAAAISRAQALAQQLTERTEWADEDRALAGALTALLDLSECDPADLERLLACEATARAGLPDDLLGLCALAGRGVHLSNGASQVPAASRVPADQPVTGALLTEPVVAPEQAEARAPVAGLTAYEPIASGRTQIIVAIVVALLIAAGVAWAVTSHNSSTSGKPGASAKSTTKPTTPHRTTSTGTTPGARPGRIAAAAVPLTLTGAGTGGSYVIVRRRSAPGAVVYEGILAPGASVHIRVSGPLWMRVGRPPHLRVLLGGRSIPLSGGTGDFTVTRTGITSPS